MEKAEGKKRLRTDADSPWHESLAKRLAGLVGELTEVGKEIEERMQLVKEREDKLAEVEAKMAENVAAAKDKVKLDVGGRIFSTAKSTLLKCEGTYFNALLSSGEFQPEDGDSYFIDRDPTFFDRILASVRSGKEVDKSGLLPPQVRALEDEMDYYMMNRGVGTGTAVRWSRDKCGGHLRVSEDGCTVFKQSGGSDWNSAVLASGDDHVPSFQVRVTARGANGRFMVGYAKADQFRRADANHNTCGWFVYGFNGTLHRCNGTCNTFMGFRALQCGDLVKVAFYKDPGLIKFQVNGQDGRFWIENVRHHGPILPCIDFNDEGASVSIVDCASLL
eukprot:TRINITY_DN17750_c0_g1_i1.p1 TRINITY_DN17750_c0_g1~~TRINITY_DN17750_c0_g1_i1.p1  ORF type:complete len:333 (+),score=73.56 TRINITY_DN17750_c0_g1_i1:72-1070(+)